MDLHPTHEDAPVRVDRVVREVRNGEPCLRVHGAKAVGGGRLEPVVFYVGFFRRVTTWTRAQA